MDASKIEYVNYEMFGAVGDGVTDDMEAIKAAHDFANANKIDVRTNPKATYYIGPRPITAFIMTNVDFGSSKFIIDDTNVKLEDRGIAIFKVVSEKEPVKLDITSLKKGQMRVPGINLPFNSWVKVDNANKKQFIRFGLNQNGGSSQTDTFVMDGTGYILNKVIWDFETVTSAIARPIDEKILTVRGGVFTSVANQAESKYNYHNRNIVINRSNTVIENITHLVVGELDHGAPYGGIITAIDCAYVTVRNCFLTPRKIYSTIGSAGKPVSMGSYALLGTNVVGLTLDNVKQYNIMDRTKWGLMATNHCKDIVVQNCVMSRFDAHENVSNLTIRNTILGHQCFNAIGHGLMIVENVTAYGSSFLNLRDDYGSTWDGDIIFRNNIWYPNTAAAENNFIGGSNAGDHDFGFPCYLPHRVTIDGLTICDGDAGENYNGCALFPNNPNRVNREGNVDYSDPSVGHPYKFSDEVRLKNIRTQSGLGFKLFRWDTKNCYCTKPHTVYNVDDEEIFPNFRAYIEDVEMPKEGLIPETSLTLGDYGNNHHLVPRIEVKNCVGVKVTNTNTPAVVKIEDCDIDLLEGDNVKFLIKD